MEILISYDCDRAALEALPLEELTHFVLGEQELPPNTEVSISFVNEDEIARLNETYRGIAGPTDVLSFECDDLGEWAELSADEPFELGDVIISPTVARRQTEAYGTSFEGEISLLLVHALLHLCGFDHVEDEEAQEMEARERELLTKWADAGHEPVRHVRDDIAPAFHSGFVTFVGRPNAGKSTLINSIVGKKVAITSQTAQTTRHRFRAVLTRPLFQLIMVDTPGLHKPHDALGEELNISALKALEDVDVLAMLIDASKPVGTGDEWVAQHVAKAKGPKLLVLSKSDLVEQETIDQQLQAAAQLVRWDASFVLSAETGEGVEAFVEHLASLLPEGPKWFPETMGTDQPFEVVIAEFIREKILRSFREEIPHAIGVAIDELKYDRGKDMYRIYATVYVERESQKGMVIGKKGSAIKQVGIEARADLEQLLGCSVFLDLMVKVKKNWRRDLNQIRRFGYGEGM